MARADGADGAGAWANYTALTVPAQAAAAQPWPSAAAAASPSVATTPWSPTLPQNALAASASQPAAAAAAASVAVGGKTKPLYDLGDDMVPQWQCMDDYGGWTDYEAAFNTTLEDACWSACSHWFFLKGCHLFSCECCLLLACAGLLRVDCKFPSAAFVLSCSRRWCVPQRGKLKNLSMHGGCGLRPSHSCSPVRIDIDDGVMQPTLVQCTGHTKP